MVIVEQLVELNWQEKLTALAMARLVHEVTFLTRQRHSSGG
jgi:hypothetical protein